MLDWFLSLLLRNLVVAQAQEVWSCREGVEEVNHDRGKRTLRFAEKNFRLAKYFFACCFLVSVFTTSQLRRFALTFLVFGAIAYGTANPEI